MTNDAIIKPEWLEIIACCCPKVQMDLIRAIVTWQTEGTLPEFRGTKKALFLMMVHDLNGDTSVAETETKTETRAEPDTPADTKPDTPIPSAETPHAETPITDQPPRRRNSQRNFFPYHPLY